MVLSTAAALVLPMRCFAFVISSASMCGVYVYAQGHLTYDFVSDLTLVIGVLVLLCWSKYKQEKMERAAFLSAHVSGPRPEVQHVAVLGGAEGAEECATEAESTTEKGQIFEKVNAGDVTTLPEQLKQIAQIGACEHWLLDNKGLTVDPGQMLGAGTFGFVVGGMLHTTPVAIKTPRLTSTDSRYSYLRELSNELRILRMLHHPNIVMLQGACIDIPAQEIALVLEMVRGEPLNNFITTKQIESSDLDRYSISVGCFPCFVLLACKQTQNCACRSKRFQHHRCQCKWFSHSKAFRFWAFTPAHKAC